MRERDRVDWWSALARRWPVQQFGQAAAGVTRSHGGSTGCTDTCVQVIVKGHTGRSVTHNRIRQLAGYTDAQYRMRSGLVASQVVRALDTFGIRYQARYDLDAREVMRLANTRGPVIVGVAYSWWPEWHGFRYGGIVSDGKPNGWARPMGLAGKTQLVGFTGAHAVLVLGYTATRDRSGVIIARNVRAKEPNHRSGTRPERPPFDVISDTQFVRAYQSYSRQLGRLPLAIAPLSVFAR